MTPVPAGTLAAPPAGSIGNFFQPPAFTGAFTARPAAVPPPAPTGAFAAPPALAYRNKMLDLLHSNDPVVFNVRTESGEAKLISATVLGMYGVNLELFGSSFSTGAGRLSIQMRSQNRY